MKLTHKIRYFFSLLKGASYFPEQLTHRLYQRYIGHSKIVAWHKGYPMYTTISPPLFSPSFANKLTTTFLASQQNRPLPYLMDIAITDKCNAKCSFCSFVGKERKEALLSKSEIITAINTSIMMGVSSVNFVGGEPLLREDLPEIIRGIDQQNTITSIFTNGYFLAQKARLLKQSGLTSVRVSLDSANPQVHDQKRNFPGLFQHAVQGLIEAKKVGLITALSCCITNQELKNGDFEKIIHLGKRLKVNEIFVFEMIPVGACLKNKLNQEALDLTEAMRIARKYNHRCDYPGIVLYSYIADKFSLGCAGGIAYLYISPYGEVYPCDFHDHSYGNIRNKELPLIWWEMSQNFERTCIGCRMKKKG